MKQKRRIYDITNVLEGVGLIEKKNKNIIQWRCEKCFSIWYNLCLVAAECELFKAKVKCYFRDITILSAALLTMPLNLLQLLIKTLVADCC